MISAKTIIREITPPIIWKGLHKVVFSSKSRLDVNTSSNTKFKGSHKGERCFILASGPSIAKQDLTGLQKEITIAVSHFNLHKDIKAIRPKYHVLAPQHPPFNYTDSSMYFSSFQSSYSDNPVTYFFGVNNYLYSYQNLLKARPDLMPVQGNVHYLNYSKTKIMDEENLDDPSLWDISLIPFAPRTVIYSAIQIAAYMEFSEIILLGCDHDYLTDMKRTSNHHFYTEESGISDKAHLESFNSEMWFREYYYRWKHYRLMSESLAKRNIQILNATLGGMLDVFPRVELSSLLR